MRVKQRDTTVPTNTFNWDGDNGRRRAAKAHSQPDPLQSMFPRSRVYIDSRIPDRPYRLLRVTDTTHVVETSDLMRVRRSASDDERVAVSLPRVKFLET